MGRQEGLAFGSPTRGTGTPWCSWPRECSDRGSTGIRNRALIVALYEGGLRVSEALALLSSNVLLYRLVEPRLGTAPRIRGYFAGQAGEYAHERLARWHGRYCRTYRLDRWWGQRFGTPSGQATMERTAWAGISEGA